MMYPNFEVNDKSFTDIARKSFKKAVTERQKHEREMDNVLWYLQPVRDRFRTKRSGNLDRTQQFDSTGITSLNQTQTMIHSLATPTGSKWFDISIKQSLMATTSINVLIRRKIQNHNQVVENSIRDSGFHPAFGLALFDILSVGTGAMAKHTDKFGEVKWFNVPITQIYVLYDEVMGCYHRVFRENPMTALDIANKYKDKKLPDEVEKALNKKDLDEVFSVIEAQITIDKVEYYGCFFNGKMNDAKQKTVSESGWELLSSVTELPSRMYYPIPWQKVPGEHWADGPGRQAVPHIQSVNKIRQLQLRHGEFAALGAWQSTNDSIINWTNQRVRAGRIYPTGGELKPLTLPGDINILDLLLTREEAAIREIMLANLIPPPENDEGTNNYVFGQRLRLFIERAGAPALNLEHEGLKPMVEGHTKDLEYYGKLEPITLKEDVFEFKINSIIKRGREAEEVFKNLETLQMVGQMAELTGDTTALRRIDMRKTTDKILEMRGYWPDCLLTDEELDEMLNTEQLMNRAQQGMEMGEQATGLLQQLNGTGLNTNAGPEVIKNVINSVQQTGAAVAKQATS